MWQCSCNITMAGGTKGGESSPKLAAIVAETAREMPCFTNIIPTQAFGAPEDFAHFMSLVQQQGGMGCYMQVGASLASGHHTDHFDFDETVLQQALELLSRVVWRLNGKDPTPKA